MDRHGHELALPLNTVSATQTVGIVGAGWAGLAAALELSDLGHRVVLWDMAPTPGGRGRSGIHQPLTLEQPRAPTPSIELDCGQHILIGAYTECLRIMRRLNVDLQRLLWRGPLQLTDAQGQGLRLPGGHPMLAFMRGLLAHRTWSLGDRARLLWRLSAWHRQGFRCKPLTTVAGLCSGLPLRVMDELIEPLCVAALNTPAAVADAQVFLRVLGDGLFAGPGGSDLLIPRAPLHDLLPGPVLQHLQTQGHARHLADRVQRVEPLGHGRWRVHAHATLDVDRLVLATSAAEAARLLRPWDADWSSTTDGLTFDPIVTTWVEAPCLALPCPMVRLSDGPAQFAFDLGQLGTPWTSGVSLVTSDAGPWLEQGLTALEEAVLRQARTLPGVQHEKTMVVRSIAERRATFRCRTGLQRPAHRAADAHGTLWLAGDYVDGPYPSTLEGAVRAGVAAAHHVNNS